MHKDLQIHIGKEISHTPPRRLGNWGKRIKSKICFAGLGLGEDPRARMVQVPTTHYATIEAMPRQVLRLVQLSDVKGFTFPSAEWRVEWAAKLTGGRLAEPDQPHHTHLRSYSTGSCGLMRQGLKVGALPCESG